MGLDVTIVTQARRDAYARSEEMWDSWKEGDPEPEPTPPVAQNLPEGPSKLHPENICTPTYLRSSYNPSGFNSAVPQYLKDQSTTLYDIFEPVFAGRDPDRDGYYLAITNPDSVREAADRARDIAKRLRALENPFATVEVPIHLPHGQSEIEAIEWTERELAKADQREGVLRNAAYSVAAGYINPKGITVYGVTKGTHGETLLIVKAQSDGHPWSASYADSAEIIAEEFCATLLMLIERDGVAYVGWSG